MESPLPSPPATPSWFGDRNLFLYRLTVATFCGILLVLVLYLLREFKAIMQPLFVAVFICYLILPIHRRLVARGIPSTLAYVVILLLILAALFGLGTLLYSNVHQVVDDWPSYKERLKVSLKGMAEQFNLDLDTNRFVEEFSLSEVDFLTVAGDFRNFFGGLVITFIYLVFLIAEKVSLTRRVALAFGAEQGQQVMQVVGSINEAIANYISVKTFISFVAGVISMAVLAIFGVDFYITWGLLIFLFNFIPYLGSMVAVAMPIGLSFLQLEPWQAIAVAILLVAVQQICGLIEPRMAGQKLGVSPLLILLSLAFWGLVWGIVGMILAVPLLMVLKIILDNIKETKAISTLMSNQ